MSTTVRINSEVAYLPAEEARIRVAMIVAVAPLEDDPPIVDLNVVGLLEEERTVRGEWRRWLSPLPDGEPAQVSGIVHRSNASSPGPYWVTWEDLGPPGRTMRRSPR